MLSKLKEWRCKTRIAIVPLTILAVIFLANVEGRAQSNSGYEMGASVLDEAGGRSESGPYVNFASMGQPSPTGESSGGPYQNFGGFIYTIRPNIELSIDTLDFGAVQVDDSSYQNFFIFNQGVAGYLTVDSIKIDNTDFAVTYPSIFPDTIEAGGSTSVTIRFAPSDTVQITGDLAIYSSAPDEPILHLPLTGYGLPPGDITGPIITHDSVTSANNGDAINIAATITDEEAGVMTAILYYRKGGELAFIQCDTMQNIGGDSLQGTIPGATVTERGVQYYIWATDSASNTDSTEVYSASVSVTDLVFDQLPSDSYRMISLPIQPSDGSPQSILVDDLGSYDNTKWRFGRWIPADSGYHEFTVNWNTGTDNFTPGRGYWLIVKDSKSIDASGTSVDILGDYAIVLQPGWNQIGCPFAFPVSWADVIKGENIKDRLVDYVDGGYQDTTLMSPWHGYWVENLGSGPDTLWVPPTESIPILLKRVTTSGPERLWEIKLSAKCGKYKDGYNYLGISPDASDGWDRLDFSEPPPAWSYVSLYFPHKAQRLHPGDYTTDFRSEFDDGQTWEFVIKTNVSPSDVELSIGQVESIPTKFEVYLFDIERRKTLNLRDEGKYSFNSGRTEREFKIAIGTSEYIHRIMDEFTSIPADFALSQNYPNPFNPTTAISYQLSGVSPHHTTLKIYNICGQLVRTLVDEGQAPGYYSVSWNGRDGLGKEVSSGIYFYRLKAEDFTKTRKMILLK